jgi:hypothetical protein
LAETGFAGAEGAEGLAETGFAGAEGFGERVFKMR